VSLGTHVTPSHRERKGHGGQEEHEKELLTAETAEHTEKILSFQRVLRLLRWKAFLGRRVLRLLP
jgi:hypothetical protein